MNWNDVAAAVEDPIDLITDLLEDVAVVGDAVRSDSDRRNFVRSSFAALEGIAFAAKQLCLLMEHLSADHPTIGVRFSPGEHLLLEERLPELDRRGSVNTKKQHLKAKANMLFAFKMFARTAGMPEHIELGDEGWASYRIAIDVRDRLTHPKQHSDLHVTDEEMTFVREALTWWTGMLTTACQSISKRSAEWREAILAKLGPPPPLP